MYDIFRERLIKCRNEKNKTQLIAAAEMGVNYRTYQRYENGDTEPGMTTLMKIANYYGVTMDYLSGRVE